jgi:hypothetical protein
MGCNLKDTTAGEEVMGREKRKRKRDGQCAEPFLARLARLAIVTGMCQESLLGALVPERPTPEIAGGSEGGRVMVEEGGGGWRSLGPEVGSSSAKIRGAGKASGQQRTPLWLGQQVPR